MRYSKPDIGFRNMRKLTNDEGRLLGLDRKMLLKIMIMAEETGKVSFWLCRAKSNEITRFNGSIDKYFDENFANSKLEQYWSSSTRP